MRLVLRAPKDLPPLDFPAHWLDADLPEGSVINSLGAAKVPGSVYHFTHSVAPLRAATSLREIERFPIVDPSSYDASHLAASVEEAHVAGRPAIMWVGHMYEIAWQIRGYEPFLIDLIDNPQPRAARVPGCGCCLLKVG